MSTSALHSPLLQLRSLNKRFGDCISTNNVSLTVQAGEIHALIGENGAGKSTLMKLLLGLFKADSGEIYFKGERLKDHGPRESAERGIGMVHQHFMLAEQLTVEQNIALFETPRSSLSVIDQKKLREKYNRIADSLGFEIPWSKAVHTLPVGLQQKVEILKVLAQNPELVIFDEPTAVLTPKESLDLLKQIRVLKEQGKTVLFISHKLKEVKAIADRVSVLRRTQLVGTFAAHDLSLDEMAHLMMTGRREGSSSNLSIHNNISVSESSAPLVSWSSRHFEYHGEKIHNLNFSIHCGEILGVLGVEGNGQNALLEALWQEKQEHHKPFVFLPSDRLKNGLFAKWPLWKDYALSSMAGLFSFRFIRRQEFLKSALKLMESNDVRPPQPGLMLQSFSGGNQQKYVVARELQKNFQLMVAPHPTRGVDIGAIRLIHQHFIALKAQKKSVLLITADLDEALNICDRIVVLYKGNIQLEQTRENFNVEQIGRAMGGL